MKGKRMLESKTRLNFWKIGFFIEFPIILALVGLVLAKSSLFLSPDGEVEKTEEQARMAFKPLKIDSWEEYTNPRFPFSFKYPSGWFLEEGENTVQVSNFSDACSQCSEREKRNFYTFFVKDWGVLEGEEKTNNAKIYVLEGMLEFEREYEKAKEAGEIYAPVISGPALYKGDAGDLLGLLDASISAVEVYPYFNGRPFGENEENFNLNLLTKEYFLIKNYHLYSLALVAPADSFREKELPLEEEHPLGEIIRSLKFEE